MLLLNLLLKILTIISPIFIFMVMGWAYAAWRNPDLSVLNRLTVDVLAPMLIVSSLLRKTIPFAEYKVLLIGALCVVLGSGVVAYAVVRWLHQDYRTWLPPMMFNNSAYMGTPVILLMFGERYVPVAVALFIVSNMLHFTLGLKLLQPQASLLKVSVNPMTISMIFAIVGAIYHVQLPEPVMQVIDMGGKAVIPLMLFALGVTLYRTKLASLRDGLLGGLLCPIAGILVAEVFCWWMPLPPLQRMMLFSFAALPPALMNYMLAQVYDQAPNKVAAIVLVGHWVSIIMMPVGVWLGGYRG